MDEKPATGGSQSAVGGGSSPGITTGFLRRKELIVLLGILGAVAITTCPEEQTTPGKIALVSELAQKYHKSHTYSLGDEFVCIDMSLDLWNQLKTAGIRAGLMAGNVEKDISRLKGENWLKYVKA